MNFSLCVPRVVKEEIRGEFEAARKDVLNVLEMSKGIDFYSTSLVKSRNVNNLYAHYAPRLMDLLVDSLDKHHYLTEEFARVSLKSLKGLKELEEDEEETEK